MQSFLFAGVLVATLAGCSLSGVVGADIIDYRAAHADATDRDLLLNIAKASHDEPLHFSEVSQIHGAAEANVGIGSSFPFGRNHDPYSVSPSASFRSSPSFDLGTLETQDFWQGIATRPVDAATIKYALENGLDERLAYLLFFSSVDDQAGRFIKGGDERRRFNNDACPGGRVAGGEPCAKWWKYMGFINSLQDKHLFGHFYSEAAPVGLPFSLKVTDGNVKDFSGIDTSKYILTNDRVNAAGKQMVQLYALLPQRRMAFCLQDGMGNSTLLGFPSDSPPTVTYDASKICLQDRVVGSPNSDGYDDSGKPPLLLSIRPVYGIIRYLGMVVRFQRDAASSGACITLNNPGEGHTGRCDGNVLFRTNDPYADSAIRIVYEGESFALRKATSCRNANICDNSVRVLGLVQLLLNLNKSAKDLPATPTFRAIP